MLSARSIPISPRTVRVMALPLAAGLGVLIGLNANYGAVATIALIYMPIALLNLPLAIALWIPIVFLALLPFVWVGPTAASAVLLIAWLGTLRARDGARAMMVRSHRRLLFTLALYVIWITLSLLWASDPVKGLREIYVWYVAGAVLIVFMTTIVTPRAVLLVAIAFVVGAVLSVVIGLAVSGLTPSGTALSNAAAVEGRLSGGSGDPNYLATGLVPAIVLAGALMGITRSILARWALLVGIVTLCGGLVATESRGGLIAAVAAAVTAVAVFRRHRAHVIMFLIALCAVAAVWFTSSPGAWQRVTNFNGGGNGRSDLWRVALRIAARHPIAGVGLAQFEIQEARYVRLPGQLTAVKLISDVPHVAHNVYLQALAEVGAVGVLALLAVVFACMLSTARAASLLDRRGERNLATLARSLLVAQVAVLVALFFISDGADERFWVLLALGPVLQGIASRAPVSRAAAPAATDAPERSPARGSRPGRPARARSAFS